MINGYEITEEEALSISTDDKILHFLEGTRLIRQQYYGHKLKLTMIINIKAGFYPENCGYCAKSIESIAPIQKYRMLDNERIIKGAEKEINDKHDIKVCAYTGMLGLGQSKKRNSDSIQ